MAKREGTPWRARSRSLARRLLRDHPRLKALILRLLNTGRYLFASARYLLRRGLFLLRPGPAAAAARWRARAQMLAAKGDWAGAVKLWRRLIKKDAGQSPESMVLDWSEYGRCCLHARRLVEAAAALESALRLQPDFTLALRLLGWIAVEQRDWPTAASRWRAALERGLKGEERAEALRTLSLALIHSGKFAEAEPLLQQLAAIRGDGGAALRFALEMRATMAELRLDDQKAREAWREMAARFPRAARRIPAYLGFMGIEDRRNEDSQAAAYTAADLRRARDAAEARLVLSYLGGLPRGEHIALMRETVDRFPPQSSPAAAELHSWYLATLSDNLLNKAELDELRARAAAGGGPQAGAMGWLLPAHAAVTAEDTAAVAKLVEAARAGLGRHTEVEKLRLWLAAKQGEHTEAEAIAKTLRRRDYTLAEDNHNLDLRPLNGVPEAGPWRRRRDRILLFTCFRNELGFAAWFLDYYRRLGVENFFIVDNVSNDGTAEFLTTQKDVTVFASRDNFHRAVSGMQWVNELIRRYGEDNWCVYVDADEQLVLPEGAQQAAGADEDGALRRFVDGMAARGEEALPAYMLDTYPADMAALKDFRPGDAPPALSNLIDPDYFFFGGLNCCFLRARGGVRERLFQIRDRIEKVPILRGGGDRLYRNNHHSHYARVSGQCAALLHHKLLREALEMLHGEASTWRIEDRLRQRRRLHEQYRQSGYLDPARGGIPRGPAAVTYESPAQLRRLGLLGPLADLRRGD